MSEIIIWSLIAYGMTTIIVYGSIFSEVRKFIVKHSKFYGTLVTCVLCTSAWVGFGMSHITGGLTNKFLVLDNRIFTYFFDGMLTSGVVWAINSVIEFFEENRFHKDELVEIEEELKEENKNEI